MAVVASMGEAALLPRLVRQDAPDAAPAAVLILVDGGEAEGPHRLGKGLGG